MSKKLFLSETKLGELISRDGITRHLVRNELLGQGQHGSVGEKSLVTLVLSLPDDVIQRIDTDSPIKLRYPDFQKAFDSDNHRLPMSNFRSIKLASSVTG